MPSIKPTVLALLLSWIVSTGVSTFAQQSARTLPDGLLGLTQEEIRSKYGAPKEIRVFDSRLLKERYFTLQEWEAFGARIYGVGEDVFYLKPKDVELRYRFYYSVDQSQSGFHPKLISTSYTVEFDRPIFVKDLTTQIPQVASIDPRPARCYIWQERSHAIRCILPSPSELAKSIRMLLRSKPKSDQWNIEIELEASGGKGIAFSSETLVRQLTIRTGSVEEADALVGKYGWGTAPNPF